MNTVWLSALKITGAFALAVFTFYMLNRQWLKTVITPKLRQSQAFVLFLLFLVFTFLFSAGALYAAALRDERNHKAQQGERDFTAKQEAAKNEAKKRETSAAENSKFIDDRKHTGASLFEDL